MGNKYQPHTSLLWYLGYHGNHTDMSITPLFYVILSPYLVQRFFGMISIIHIPLCYSS